MEQRRGGVRLMKRGAASTVLQGVYEKNREAGRRYRNIA